jgi:hypothetical protein
MTRTVFSTLVVRLAALFSAACGSSSPSNPQHSSNDGGLSLNLPPASCVDSGALAPADAATCAPLLERSFSRDVLPLFNGCAGEICHDFGAGAIANQAGVVSTECCGARVIIIDPGHPERSYLLNKLTAKNMCAGWQMPLDRPPFTADDIQIVTDWICQGAGTSP